MKLFANYGILLIHIGQYRKFGMQSLKPMPNIHCLILTNIRLETQSIFANIDNNLITLTSGQSWVRRLRPQSDATDRPDLCVLQTAATSGLHTHTHTHTHTHVQKT